MRCVCCYTTCWDLTLKPRPVNLIYAAAAAASMRDDHRPMVVALLTLLNQHI